MADLEVTILEYPDSAEVSIDMRPVLHPKFQALAEGISEFTFANIYLFRRTHNYRISQLEDGLFVITGRDDDNPFFMLPFGLPDENIVRELFDNYHTMKAATAAQAEKLTAVGYSASEDRDNFDYLYSLQDMVNLTGRKFHRKKNLLNIFIKNNECQAKPLLEEYREDALQILEKWNNQHGDPNDFHAAKEALEKMWPLQLCGGIFYIDGQPVAYCLGEELALGRSFVIHFEKAVLGEDFKGIYQYINQAFASILPEKYETVNRQQDLGESGLRQAKTSYRPVDFVKKYKVESR
ncbi:MAG: DUF2156 domain-containing protein [Sedimentisphaerales bacterium]|nr:DUF2156 domain-containing protein [Sedimentisphaerales bacterium]